MSRERLEECERRLLAADEERRLLLDRLALLRGEPPIFARPQIADVPAKLEREPEPEILRVETPDAEKASVPAKKMVAGSVTADYVLAQAAEAVRHGKRVN